MDYYAKMITQEVWRGWVGLFVCSVVTKQFFVISISRERFHINHRLHMRWTQHTKLLVWISSSNFEPDQLKRELKFGQFWWMRYQYHFIILGKENSYLCLLFWFLHSIAWSLSASVARIWLSSHSCRRQKGVASCYTLAATVSYFLSHSLSSTMEQIEKILDCVFEEYEAIIRNKWSWELFLQV